MNRAVKLGAGLIALYLLVAYAGGSKLLSGAASGGTNVIKAFQGR